MATFPRARTAATGSSFLEYPNETLIPLGTKESNVPMKDDIDNVDLSLSNDEKEAPSPNLVTFDNTANYLLTEKG